MYKIKEAILSSKCQITVPKVIRDMLKVEPGQSIAFYIEENNIMLTNVKNLNIYLKDKNKKVALKREGK